jgi:inosine-uridine nucleoside N-ribohydrolase
MRIWIDTDVGDNPDDAIALWCAARSNDATLAGVSTVSGNVERRAAIARDLLPGVEVVAGPPTAGHLANVDVLLGIGPWTHLAELAVSGLLPRRVVVMGGLLGPVEHRGALQHVEHNVAADPGSAAKLLRTTGSLIVVPLNSTALVVATEDDERELLRAIPKLDAHVVAWRQANGPVPLVLHDPAALLVALGERIARMESRRLRVEPDGRMLASVDGPIQHVVAYVNADATLARVRKLAAAPG